MYQRNSYDAELGAAIAGIVLFLVLVAAFLITVAVCYVVRCFVKYGKEHKSLWIAFAGFIASVVASGVIGTLTQYPLSLFLAGLGSVALLITCLVVDLKNRDLLQPEKTNLVDQVLHSSWWGSENTPLETEHEQVAA